MVFGNDGGFGGSGFVWAFLIFALLMGWGNWGGNGNAAAAANAIGYENLATSAEVQRGFNEQNSMANQRDILAAVNAGTAQSVQATNNVFHDTINALSDKYGELQRDIANVNLAQANALANQNECCSSTKMVLADGFAQTNANIAQNKYEAAMNTAAVNANIAAQTQKVLEVLSQNKIESLQGRVNQLELQNAVAGVVRYPNSMAYNAGTSPFCGCGNGCGYPLYS